MQIVECQQENTPETLDWGLPNLALPCGEIPAGRDPLVNLKNFQIPNFPSGGPLLPYGARVPQEAAAFPVGGCLWNWRRPQRFRLPLQRHFRRRGGGVHLRWVSPTTGPPDPAPKLRNPPVVGTARGGGQQWSGDRGNAPHVGRTPGVGRFLCRYGGEGTPVQGDVNKFKLQWQ